MTGAPREVELQVVDTTAPPLDGRALIREIGALLAADLPSVPFSDPYRVWLVALAHACEAGSLPRPSPAPRSDA
jgi:hypothetical protein